ncbi:MAG: cell division protein SepF [Synergistaceae bacterium]|nr:cell division protein SepF [Synergistaceae bacterium]
MLERLMALLGLVDRNGEEFEDEDAERTNGLEEREERILRPPLKQADIILLRGSAGVERKEELAEELRKGRMVLLDLRGMEREPGQSLLDFLCGVASASRGRVVRVAGGVFLVAPKKTMIEEWEETKGV